MCTLKRGIKYALLKELSNMDSEKNDQIYTFKRVILYRILKGRSNVEF